MPSLITTTAAIRQQIRDWRAAGLTTALVPTMGGIHAGHLALMDAAHQMADKVVVSIYVNPTQFAVGEDFDRYPRQMTADCDAIGTRADCVFAPATLYTETHATMVTPAGAALGLEAEHRPHFFAGVATIVLKLFNQMPVDVAVFGEKDFQQLAVIKQMVRDLDLPIEIIGHPTIRDSDGLALSSRNAYLTPQERPIAAQLYQTLTGCAAAITAGASMAPTLAIAQDELIHAGFTMVDYLTICDSLTLAPITDLSGPARLLVAARLGDVRLLDNILVEKLNA